MLSNILANQITKEQQIIYYWYDHLILRKTGEDKIVEKAIKEHDFDTFVEFRMKYPNEPDCVFFPDTAYVYDLELNDFVGVVDITTPENFACIDDQDYECG